MWYNFTREFLIIQSTVNQLFTYFNVGIYCMLHGGHYFFDIYSDDRELYPICNYQTRIKDEHVLKRKEKKGKEKKRKEREKNRKEKKKRI